MIFAFIVKLNVALAPLKEKNIDKQANKKTP